jgi:hypothetical protein
MTSVAIAPRQDHPVEYFDLRRSNMSDAICDAFGVGAAF